MNQEQRGRREQKKQSALGRWRAERRAWIANMTRGQRIRHRLLQALVIISILIIAVWAGISMWIRAPKLPDHGNPDRPASSSSGMEDWEVEIPDVARSGRREGVYTFLVVGQDTRGGGNTDTMLLLTYDTKAKTIHGLNLPRDTMVNVSTTSKRLNAVYNYNKGRDKDTQVEKGMAALKKEVGKLTGIVPDYYVIVQWEAVGELVDALGGVYFDVPFDMDYDDPYQDLYIHQKQGYRKLSGDDAMQVIRWRKNNGKPSGGDVVRIGVQQDFLKAAAKECLKPATLLKAPALIQVFLDNVVTDLDMGNLLYFAQKASGMDAETGVVLNTMPWTDARYPKVSMVLPIKDELLQLLNDGMNPYLKDIQSSDLQLLYRNSDGSYGVTSGTLADPKLANPRTSSKPKPKPEPKPDPKPVEPVEPENPAVDPEKPVEPVEPGKPVDPGKPVEPVEPVEPPKPVEPENPDPNGGTAPGGQPEQPGGGEIPEWQIPVTP